MNRTHALQELFQRKEETADARSKALSKFKVTSKMDSAILLGTGHPSGWVHLPSVKILHCGLPVYTVFITVQRGRLRCNSGPSNYRKEITQFECFLVWSVAGKCSASVPTYKIISQ